jgi:hypothetical protein
MRESIFVDVKNECVIEFDGIVDVDIRAVQSHFDAALDIGL